MHIIEKYPAQIQQIMMWYDFYTNSPRKVIENTFIAAFLCLFIWYNYVVHNKKHFLSRGQGCTLPEAKVFNLSRSLNQG